MTIHISMSLSNTLRVKSANINIVSNNFIITQFLGIDKGVDYSRSGKIRRID